jgi:hypothetical protein
LGGGFQQNGGGTLTIEVAGTAAAQHDQILVAGQAQLAGRLVVAPANGYQACEGDSFVVMTYAGHSGVFDEIVAGFGRGLIAHPIYRASHLALLVADPVSGVEAPASESTLPTEAKLRAYLVGGREAVFCLELPCPSQVRISLFDLIGRLVAQPIAGSQSAGTRERRWAVREENGRPLVSGVYFVRGEVVQDTGTFQVLRSRLPVLH